MMRLIELLWLVPMLLDPLKSELMRGWSGQAKQKLRFLERNQVHKGFGWAHQGLSRTKLSSITDT